MGNAQKKGTGTNSGVASPARSRAREGNPGNSEGKKTLVNGAYTAESERRRDDTGNTGAHGMNLDAPAGDLPPELARLKNEGNMLFKNGQFGHALGKYTQAISGYTESGIDSPEDLCILYSNRAACFLKDGNCTECIQDCTSALELRPFTLKPLLRRAMAYDSLERYRQAYVDYKTVLQIDSSVQAAHDSVHRITKQLMEQDGPDWREKLPEIPNVPISAQQHHKEEQSAEVLQARAARAEEEKGSSLNTNSHQTPTSSFKHCQTLILQNFSSDP
ncbi:hypothetical protein QTP86_030534 [Hemibagrus guttatus]|nr:hypothetical protein QTP86_030534 [Hemibagrus guttatus]